MELIVSNARQYNEDTAHPGMRQGELCCSRGAVPGQSGAWSSRGRTVLHPPMQQCGLGAIIDWVAFPTAVHKAAGMLEERLRHPRCFYAKVGGGLDMHVGQSSSKASTPALTSTLLCYAPWLQMDKEWGGQCVH